MPGAQVKDEQMYQRLRQQGESKEMSARIANAPRLVTPRVAGAAR